MWCGADEVLLLTFVSNPVASLQSIFRSQPIHFQPLLHQTAPLAIPNAFSSLPDKTKGTEGGRPLPC